MFLVLGSLMFFYQTIMNMTVLLKQRLKLMTSSRAAERFKFKQPVRVAKAEQTPIG